MRQTTCSESTLSSLTVRIDSQLVYFTLQNSEFMRVFHFTNLKAVSSFSKIPDDTLPILLLVHSTTANASHYMDFYKASLVLTGYRPI